MGGVGLTVWAVSAVRLSTPERSPVVQPRVPGTANMGMVGPVYVNATYSCTSVQSIVV